MDIKTFALLSLSSVVGKVDRKPEMSDIGEPNEENTKDSAVTMGLVAQICALEWSPEPLACNLLDFST